MPDNRFRDLKGSWYSQAPGWVDRMDRPGSAALQVGGKPIADELQGIALPDSKTLGQWFDVEAPNGQIYRLQQTDIGPARWTGRGVDISAAAAIQMGYTPKTFPTDARFKVSPAEGPGASGSPAGPPVQAADLGVPTADPQGPPLPRRRPTLADLPERARPAMNAFGGFQMPEIPAAAMERPMSYRIPELTMPESLLGRYGRAR